MPDRPILVVDLDGTLIRSDMLFETFWSAFARDWTTPLWAARALQQGRAALKSALLERAEIDASVLPYNGTVLAHIRKWRAEGGRTALVTASDQRIASEISAHLGLFDEAHGSDGETNLKGAQKAAFLEARYGRVGFAYLGDAEADLAIWAVAAEAQTVTPSTSLRAAVERLAVPHQHLPCAPAGLGVHLRAMRPHQWLKNLLVFVPMLAAHDLSLASFAASLLAFVCFCLVASSVYLFNDLLDLSADRAHPRKRFRPLAAGDLPIQTGSVMAPALLGAGLVLGVGLGAGFLIVLLGYVLMTAAYSLVLKRLLVIDICVLALLFTARIVAGGAATGVPLSVWLLAFAIFFFLSLAAVKRQGELVDARRAKRVLTGRAYEVRDTGLVASMAMASGYMSVLVMALYLNSPTVTRLYQSPPVLWGICIVLVYWISRTVFITHRGEMSDDPIVFAVRDRVSLLCAGAIVVFAVAAAII